MYFFIAGITTQILLWVFIVMISHVGFNVVMSIFNDEKFKLPFYLKPIYPYMVKLINKHEGYEMYNEEKPLPYWGFILLFSLIYMFSIVVNMLLFPIITIPIATYLFISIKIHYGSVDKK